MLKCVQNIYSKTLTAKCNQCSRRFYKTKQPRVRFAPSPTGFLHLGGLRTALYNYLFALSKNGTMILRIEDTDQTRKVEGSVDALISDLDWVGIKCHEGPHIGGQHGPYIQSQRLEMYRTQVEKLIEKGAAYRCFCSEKRLDLLRRDAVRMRQVPKYDNKCRNLSKEDIESRLQDNKEYCVRFKLTDDVKSFDDLIFGGIAHDITLTEGDPVILKSDGWPTYHLANVVDDHFMEISHVLRGVEWQISTTKHIMMYRALGWEPPQYGHLPLIVNADGTKLSKRQSDIRVGDYNNNGIFPLALVNYITLSGGGFDHIPGSGVRLKTYQDLAKEFDLEKISSHPSRLNSDLLNECNRLELIRQIDDDDSLHQLITQVQLMVKAKYPAEKLDLSDNHIRSILKWSRSRLINLTELTTSKYAFLWILPENVSVESEYSKCLDKIIEVIDNIEPYERENVKNELKDLALRENLKFNDLMKTLRSILSGLEKGPSVAEMLEILGRDASRQRIKRAIN